MVSPILRIGLWLFISAYAGLAVAGETKIRIGVLGDQSGPFSDIGGAGAVLAARMAAADFGGTVLGRPIEVLSGDTQNKPDIAATIARRWFDVEGVDTIVDLPVTSVAMAVQFIGRDRKRVVLQTAAASAELTQKGCSPYSVHWTDDTNALAIGATQAIIANGGRTWFFLTPDYSFGAFMEKAASDVVKSEGGVVVGGTKFPFGTPDYSSYLLTAAGSKAQVFALSTVGGDTLNAMKQAHEFGLTRDGPRIVVFNIFINEVNALGLNASKGLYLTSGFYWDENEKTRAWARRFFEVMKRMPNKTQANTYAAVFHYLRAVKEAGTDDAAAVAAKMRKLVGDYFGKSAHIRNNGRVVYDLTLYETKTPAESKYPWDYLKAVRAIEGERAFGPDTKDCAGDKG